MGEVRLRASSVFSATPGDFIMDTSFAGNSYDTPHDRRDIYSKILFNSRFNFFLRVCTNFYFIGRCAKAGRFNSENQARFSARNIDILERCGAQIHIRGLDFLSAEEGPFVIAGNHMSAVETIMLNALISPRLDFTFVIKEGIFGVPFIRHAMHAIDAIGVGQVNPREDFKIVMQKGRKQLEQGRSVLIFPEASRFSEFKPERFNTIAVKLARSAGVKVIPFALKTDFLKLGRLFNNFGPVHPANHIHFEFGAPVPVSGNCREAQEHIVRFIGERCRSWNRKDEFPLPSGLLASE